MIMPSKLPAFHLRMDSDTRNKIRYIAEYEGNSANAEIVGLIHKRIAEFERDIEKINIDEIKKYLR